MYSNHLFLRRCLGLNKFEARHTLSQIEKIRKRMIEIALIEGFTSKESILLSQELDLLLNKYEINKSLQ